ncbi:response regulator [Candidatus Sumerlaeota bacterium]|nr:response regulator [Candidatus Sumerlaeota bacterium]
MNKYMNILIVDDDQRMVKTLVDILQLKGFKAEGSHSPKKALERLIDQDFDCVLTDIKMPEMNGIEFFRAIRNIRPDVAVVFMTAYATNEIVEEGIHEGVIATLNKPLDINLLLGFFSFLGEEPSVVIVDDDPQFCKTLAAILHTRGFHVIEISDPHALYDFLKPNNQVVLLDMKLNSTSGLDVLRNIREKYSHLPVVLVTGFRKDMAASIEAAMKINVFTCLYKPFQIDELLSVLKTIHHKELGRFLKESLSKRR